MLRAGRKCTVLVTKAVNTRRRRRLYRVPERPTNHRPVAVRDLRTLGPRWLAVQLLETVTPPGPRTDHLKEQQRIIKHCRVRSEEREVSERRTWSMVALMQEGTASSSHTSVDLITPIIGLSFESGSPSGHTCHFADASSPSILKQLPKGEGGGSRMTRTLSICWLRVSQGRGRHPTHTRCARSISLLRFRHHLRFRSRDGGERRCQHIGGGVAHGCGRRPPAQWCSCSTGRTGCPARTAERPGCCSGGQSPAGSLRPSPYRPTRPTP